MARSRRIGTFAVAPIGLGCMNLTHAYGQPPTAEVAKQVLLRALDLGVTHFDCAALYGFGRSESLLGEGPAALPQPHSPGEQVRHDLASMASASSTIAPRRYDARSTNRSAVSAPTSSTSTTCIDGTVTYRSRTASAPCVTW
jgi:hypothetical protein